LDLFLQQVALVTDIDRHDPAADAVTLMTLHNAKGLEYPVVFISGLEDGLFPLARAYEEPALLEEERRLFYVGITRARDTLRLSWANERRRGGSFMVNVLSSFVDDIPEALLSTRRSSSREPWEEARHGSDAPPASARPRARYSAEPPDEDDREAEARDLALDEEMNQDLPDLRRGERVRHPTFGAGRVVDVSGSGRDVKVVVDFRSVGRKKLVARFAGLEREGE
jgi:DNA helicase-2/ATP-dependent DNA helicase PcrA